LRQSDPIFSITITAVKRKTTVYLEDDLIRAMSTAATRIGKPSDQIVEDALRAYLGFELLERVGARSTITEEDALILAYRELHKPSVELRP
jgi:predicted transcriptional regulator